jgi:hypothetical protein
MKTQVRSAILIAAALAVVASSQAATYNGDLVIGFTSASGNDFELDLGSASSLTSGQFNLGSQLSGFNLNTVNWGVVGTGLVGSTRTAWVTVDTGLTPGQVPSLSRWSSINNAVSSLYNLFPTAGAGNSATPTSLDDNSWNQQTRVGGLGTQYHNVYQDPGVVGLTSADFYAVTIGTGSPTLLGTFSLSGNGIVTFAAVPEPSTFGMLASMGLLALCLRRQFRKATA